MSKNVKVFNLLGEVLHSQWALDVAFDCPVQSLIKVDTGCTVYDNVASVYDQLQIFRTKANVLFFQIALTNLLKNYIGFIFF